MHVDLHALQRESLGLSGVFGFDELTVDDVRGDAQELYNNVVDGAPAHAQQLQLQHEPI